MKERPSVLRIATIATLCVASALMLVLLGKELVDNPARVPGRHMPPFGIRPLTPPTVNTIQAWMTFDYLDHVFKVPSAYLKTYLSITDTRYPRLSLTKFSADEGISPDAAVLRVQNALRAYPSTSTTTP